MTQAARGAPRGRPLGPRPALFPDGLLRQFHLDALVQGHPVGQGAGGGHEAGEFGLEFL